MNNDSIKNIITMKSQFHLENASIPFEEKVRQIIRLQQIDTEFNKHRRSPRAQYMRVWPIDEQ